jgi:hypothetical protein
LLDPRGPRFAAAVTSVVLVLVLFLQSGWLALAQALVFTAFALVAAFLNAAFGLCLGCELYLAFRRLTRAEVPVRRVPVQTSGS